MDRPSCNDRLGLMRRMRRRARNAQPLCQALVALCALCILLLAPAALVAHELQHALAGSESTQHQGKHVKPACEVCTIYASFEHALASPDVSVLATQDFESNSFFPRREFFAARITLFHQRAPPNCSALA